MNDSSRRGPAGGRLREVDVSPERLRALVSRRVPHTLLLDLLRKDAPTSAQILRDELHGDRSA
ncbi:hypothetical protein [Cellulomonas sp.]|uniref:hypothetical protein n=1 Tax=Cellulomonas sp. TaxID=40001 RepID=UPI00258BBD41|nr:hypothetical protein [Cellulomonas sp.]MCR6689525.1 hypothetical protein [Cellulomonas sp.]